MKRITLLLICTMCFFATASRAQVDTCVSHLKDASDSYDQGDFDIVISSLRNIIGHCDLAKEDRVHAYKLLILSYLNIDDLESADKAADAILRLDPNEKPDKFKDDAKLVNLFEKFQPQPTFGIGIHGGVNYSMEHTVNQYSVVFPDGQAPASYKSHTEFQLGVQAEKRIYGNLWAELGVSYRVSAYTHILNDVDSNTVNYSEKLTYIDIPLNARYYFTRKGFMPYVQAGGVLSLLASAQSTTTSADQKDIVDRTSFRNTIQIGASGGIGLAYRIKNFLLFANVQYIYYPTDVNKAGTRYDDPINLYKYYYVDDDFTLNYLQANVGATFMLMYRNIKIQ